MSDRDGNPAGFRVVAKFSGGEVMQSDTQTVVLASPYDQEHLPEDEHHNCDAMGCGFSHVVWRERRALPPVEPGEPTPETLTAVRMWWFDREGDLPSYETCRALLAAGLDVKRLKGGK